MSQQTISRPAANRPTGGARPAAGASDQVLVAATGMVALGALLTALPLRSIFTDWAWLTVSIGCVLPYLVIVGLFRFRGQPRWWHTAVGLAGSVLTLFWVFVPKHLAYGVIPTPASLHDIGDLITLAHTAMQAEHAPLPSSPALRLLVATALVALIALTDVLGVLLRRPLLASAPLLEVLAIASATSSRATNPIWFAAAAIGFLLILLTGTRLQDRAWGPSVDGSAGRLGGARRMAVAGIVAALIVPLALPSVNSNLLARATHHNGDGSGDGSGGQIVLNSLASLRGSLQRPTPAVLFQVQVGTGDAPFYIRQEIDDEVTEDGWQPSGTRFGDPDAIPLADNNYPVAPADSSSTAVGTPFFQLDAHFTILGLGGKTLPILAVPSMLRSENGGTWNSRTASVFNVSLKKDQTYDETVQQPAPSVAQLQAAGDWAGSGDKSLDAQYLDLPAEPSVVNQLAATLTAGKSTSYDKALAISDYFTNGKNGFIYSLDAPPNDGRSAIATFLDKKQGFCQQYAATAAVLMRAAGLPTRVVIGYTHEAPDAQGVFQVTTADAHAWVEVFFNDIGWIAFDPTPLGGSDLSRAVSLPWATHPLESSSTSAAPTDANRPSSDVPQSASAAASAEVVATQGSSMSPIIWQAGLIVLAVLALGVLVLFGPRWLRKRQRSRRLDRARATGNPEPLWLELAATAVDRDALWPSTLTVRQVPEWLARHGIDERGQAALSVVAASVERDRFSSQLITELPAESVVALDQALTRWARRTDRRLTLLSRWLPRSLFGRAPRWQR